jgi:hypothetical protein
MHLFFPPYLPHAPTLFIHRHLTTRMIFGAEYRSWRPPLFISPSPVIFSPLDPNFSFNNRSSSFLIKHQVSYQHNTAGKIITLYIFDSQLEGKYFGPNFNKRWLRSQLFCVTTQTVAAISYRRFGTTYRPRCEGLGQSLKMGPIACPETSVINYHFSMPNNTEEPISHALRSGSLKSRKALLEFGPILISLRINFLLLEL